VPVRRLQLASRAGELREASVTDKVNLQDKLALFSDHWRPRIVGELNGHQVKLAKLKGEFVWHRHEHEDEMFLVLKGTLVIRMRDRAVTLQPGEMYIVPRDTEHQPVADDEVHVLLVEPAGTLNTGDVRDALTVDRPSTI
jgi:mannose-6-phosphate isomerase-like protein (cupin superfamily)